MWAGRESRYWLMRGGWHETRGLVMSFDRFVLGAAIALWLGAPSTAPAQERATVPGMFGQRALGTTLAPRTRSFASGAIVTDPSGSFLGRGRVGGMQFNSMPWQYPNVGLRPGPLVPPPRPWEAALERLAEASAPSANPPLPPQGLLAQPPAGPSPPDGTEAPQPQANGATALLEEDALAPAEAPAAPPPFVTTWFGGTPAPVDPAARLAERIRRTDRIQKRSPITVELRGQTVILRGRVATEHDRRLTEALAGLEPGIGRVQNELRIETNDPAP